MRGLLIGLLVLVQACTGGRSSDVVEAVTDVGVGRATDDVVVIAIIDTHMNPYHWDFLASQMPQHRNADPADDLPLDQDPASWLSGHPGAQAFRSYQALNLSLEDAAADPLASSSALHEQDAAEWAKLRYSEGTSNDAVHMYWVPGSKIIGHVAFGTAQAVLDPTASNLVDAYAPASGPVDSYASEGHGIGSASVSAGNIHGTCPNCLLVIVHGYSEQANEWVASQDWIDLQSNSWGLSTVGGLVRDNIYAGSDTESQRVAIERGQAWFQSAGNGVLNAFTVSGTTLLSSQKGPDWVVTVGAIESDGSSIGHHRPVDVSSIGSSYPSATYGGDTVTAEGSFNGTSNATPVVAGLYGQALHELRRMLAGPSRLQWEGEIARGPAGCAAANPQCALSDGIISVHEMQRALLQAARHTEQGNSILYQVGGPDLPGSQNNAELEYVSEGQGSYFGLLQGEEVYRADVQRIVDLVTGDQAEVVDADLQAWLIADSLCRQTLWGPWAYGAYDGGNAPENDPAWPLRNWLVNDCPQYLPSVVEALQFYAGLSEVGAE